MNQLSATESTNNVVRIETSPAFIYGYDRALKDIRLALSFEGGDHADMDVVLTLLERQNSHLRQDGPARR